MNQDQSLEANIETAQLQSELKIAQEMIHSLRSQLKRQEMQFRSILETNEERSQLHLLWQTVEQSANSIVITNAKGDIEYVNPHFTTLTGYTLEEVIGENPRILKSGYTSPLEYKNLWETISSGQTWEGEFHNAKKNGEFYWEYATISPVFDHNKSITHFVAIKEDISKRKHLEEQLHASEQLMRSTIDALSAHIAVLDQNGNILNVNKAWKMFAEDNDGSGNQVLLGANYFDVIRAVEPTSEDYVTANAVLEGISRVARGEIEEFSLDYPCHSPHEQRWFTVRVTRSEEDDYDRLVVTHENVTNRKLGEHHLRESERRFRILSEMTSDYAYAIEIDSDGTSRIEWVTEAFNKITGYSTDEAMQGGRWKMLVHPDDKDRIAEHVEKLYGGQPDRREFRIITRSGETRWLEEYCTPIWNEQQRVATIYGAAKDITDRKSAETSLVVQNHKLHTLNRVIWLMNSIRDPHHFLQIACEEFVKAFDSARVSVAIWDKSLSGFKIVTQSDVASYEASIGSLLMPSQCVAHRYLLSYNLPLVIRKNEKSLNPSLNLPDWVNNAMLIPLNVENRLQAIFCIEMDIDYRFDEEEKSFAATFVQAISPVYENTLLHQQLVKHNVELGALVEERTKQLKRTNERLTSILDSTNDAILLLDNTLHIRSSNRAFDELFSYTHDELFNQHISRLLDKDHQSSVIQAFDVVAGSSEVERIQIPMRDKHGRTFDGDIVISAIRENSGHLVCSIRDITEFKRLDKMKDEFVSMVSHELRTPITSISLSSDILMNYYDRLGEDKRLHKIDQIHQQANRLSQLINAILDTSRLDARLGKRGTAEVDTRESLQMVLGEMDGMAQAKELDIEVAIFNQDFVVISDPIDISSMWRNLISNAIKYTQAGGAIKIELFGAKSQDSGTYYQPNFSDLKQDFAMELQSEDYLFGVIQDNGPGIEPDDIPNLFERFFRGWATSTNIVGTGLGLSFVKEVLNINGGDIVVSSEVGQGTSFLFWLPVDR